MTKLYIPHYPGERYPDYSIRDEQEARDVFGMDDDDMTDVPDDVAARWLAVCAAYGAMQAEVDAFMKADLARLGLAT